MLYYGNLSHHVILNKGTHYIFIDIFWVCFWYLVLNEKGRLSSKLEHPNCMSDMATQLGYMDNFKFWQSWFRNT